MKFKAALFYQNSLVFYSIYHLGDNYFKAKLDNYSMDSSNPPLLLELYRQNSQWNSNCSEGEIVKELGAAIDQRVSHS